jgi:hypothetical protein
MKRLFAIAVCGVLALAGQVGLSRCRPVKAPAMEEGFFAALGGLRSLLSEIVWFRADRLQEEGRYVELAQLAHALALAEPHTPEIWSYAAWNLAYNVSVMMPTPEDRWRWVQSALVLLRDHGILHVLGQVLEQRLLTTREFRHRLYDDEDNLFFLFLNRCLYRSSNNDFFGLVVLGIYLD